MKRFLPVLAALGFRVGCLWNLGGPPPETTTDEEGVPREIDWTLVQREFPVLRVLGGDTIEVEYPIRGSWEKVQVKLTGACGNCPGAMMTLKGFVREVLKQHVPEVVDVEPV